MEEVGYKVLRRIHVCGLYHKLVSAVTNEDFPQHYITRYCPYDWTYPKIEGTKLFAFKDYHEAREFKDIFWNSDHTIYKVLLKNPSTEFKPVEFDYINRYWEDITLGIPVIYPIHRANYEYESCISAEAIKLIERIV